jgi:hypothetical protein
MRDLAPLRKLGFVALLFNDLYDLLRFDFGIVEGDAGRTGP